MSLPHSDALADTASTSPQSGRSAPSPASLKLYRTLLRVRPAAIASWAKRLLRIRRTVVTTAAGQFWADPASHLGLRLIEQGEYEPEMAAVLDQLLTPGQTFVDLGANEGYFSVLGARLVGPTGRVIAIEPQPRLTPVLERNIALNRLTNVSLVSVAVSDTAGTAALYMAPDTNTGSTGLTRATRYSVGTTTVPTRTLAEVVAEVGLQTIDLLKVDIEGFEYEAILGSADLFRAGRVRTVALELHPWILERRGLDPDQILAVFHDAGYAPDPRFTNLVLRAPR